MNTKKSIKKLNTIITIVVFLSLIVVFADSLLRKESFSEKYGFSPIIVSSLFIVAEFFFDLGIFLMLKGGGVFKLTLKDIFSFDFSKVKFRGRTFFIGFIMNRLAAFLPWTYIIAVGWRTLPFTVTGLILLELIIVVILTIGVLELTNKKMKTRRATLEDVDEIIEVEKRAWPEGGAATKEQFISRIKTFPEGVIVAVEENKIAGVVVGELINYNYLSKKNICWADITDKGNITKSHNPKGDALFGVDLSVDPDFQKKGVGKKLLLEIGRLAVKNNLRAGILGARMPHYHKYSKKVKPEEYINYCDNEGKLIDPELRFYKKAGVKFLKVVENYYPDEESLNYGVLCEWTNPLYLKSKLAGKIVGPIVSLAFRI